MSLAEESPTEVAKASPREISMMERELSGWAVINDEGMQKLEKEYRFPDFAEAMVFVNRVGKIAEDFGHHPEITFTWGARRCAGGRSRWAGFRATTSSWPRRRTR